MKKKEDISTVGMLKFKKHQLRKKSFCIKVKGDFKLILSWRPRPKLKEKQKKENFKKKKK